ncbi:catalytic subunit of the NatB N-terminal acetyltransferase [Nadsonia fulvescens var. elongata DSM 6958]|uniref:Catalytic subunit of the NatB N-terminal acetyltransferase n=1 Tax=Nadsonia fulvescens var. elongata DSM 6958 TaxID=857566 RepID=A0A1E3PKN3_9ASCO|nr:catalytic subunit of the NatB N-terminal acetyltransferase [Nadsonia fulvescens var. elongata DSM 6958]
MSTIKPFHAIDLFKTNHVNLDVLTENYQIGFYLQYLALWPTLFFQSQNTAGEICGYMMAKTEGKQRDWHGHITAVTVAPDSRRVGIARDLCKELERRCDDPYEAYFLDLFVRTTNVMAINMYKGFGYSVFRRVVGYYGSGDNRSDTEDAFDMRLPLKRDTERQSVRENGETFRVSPSEVVF